jgi:hypothetical protein
MGVCGDDAVPADTLKQVLMHIGTADILIPYYVNLKHVKSRFRYLLSRAYTILLNLLFNLRLHYYNGLPVLPLRLLRERGVVSEGFGFQAEILVKLIKSGSSYKEVAVDAGVCAPCSRALRLRNVISVSGTILHLLYEVYVLRRRGSSVIVAAPAKENRD